MIKLIVFMLSFGLISYCSATAAEREIIDSHNYIKPVQAMDVPIQRDYLKLDYAQLGTTLNPFIRDPDIRYPGDYFWPPDGLLQNKDAESTLKAQLTVNEIDTVRKFLKYNFPTEFSGSATLLSLKGYAYNFPGPGGPRREAYTMFTEGDTVYVVSGWLGKFLSFYRVVPGDSRLTVPQLMKQLEILTPLAKEIKEGSFKHVSDSLNYLLEYVDKDKMFRVRNYLMKTVLPPDPPVGKEKFYNLIEITKFYDKGAVP
jgi:hypothetical protein